MTVLNGKGVLDGIAIGKIVFYQRKGREAVKRHAENTEEELRRYRDAKQQEAAGLKKLYEKALHEAGEKSAKIFEIHQMILEDIDFCDAITDTIQSERVNAEYAVKKACDTYVQTISAIDDPYLKERAADIKDISQKLIEILANAESDAFTSDEPVIIVADDLTPSETVQMDKSKILAFITINGSVNSHTAILARSMNIPAVVAVGEQLGLRYNGKNAIVDGASGRIYIEPDTATLKLFSERKEAKEAEQEQLHCLKGKNSVTIDGRKIKIFANIGGPQDVEAVLNNDAEGIGLFRSEFLYLGRETYPTEEEQFQAYRSVAEKMKGKQVIIRTLDIGADKQADYFEMPKEENPAMGCRAIRICLTRQDVFKTQLRALYRATAFGNIAIMFPMIISVGEVRAIKQIAQAVQLELSGEGAAYNPGTKLGIMVETPAAALISDELAKEVDFFSIGTNDLTQYTLAIDRQNPGLEHFYDAHHKAVLTLIRITAENAHKNGIFVGICGELGADLSLTETFLRMEIDDLSVSAPCVLPLRKKVMETRVDR
ncbi:phosphoenolpyruvate--protein phosphotransferase [Caproiciproducens sp. CPB-2]|uniref:phosphoenolpyruvate--protein phosphotransferase n=1 Tax=Caproiciproducens sp. CPB-2 TaxID=3030017 RepID=UPI0023DAE550|nr:phosphoenolpyruvate--protein phosphotransferase [Caproiciproducens sp. CPB-2]MDF1493400.1 phosphoenolpyruvate--protein phosphotransferase [Caproiciproducens sp. CPB-2]